MKLSYAAENCHVRSEESAGAQEDVSIKHVEKCGHMHHESAQRPINRVDWQYQLSRGLLFSTADSWTSFRAHTHIIRMGKASMVIWTVRRTLLLPPSPLYTVTCFSCLKYSWGGAWPHTEVFMVARMCSATYCFHHHYHLDSQRNIVLVE